MAEETQKDIKDSCTHQGFYTGVGQTVLMLGNDLLVIASLNCVNCGFVFTKISKMPVTGTVIVPSKLNS